MGLLDRILGLEDPSISVHALGAAAGEYLRGKITAVEMHSVFGITTQADKDGLQVVLDAVKPPAGKPTMTPGEVEDILVLGNERAAGGNAYYLKAKVKSRLGI